MEGHVDGRNECGIVEDTQNHTTGLINVENDLTVDVVLVPFELLVNLLTNTLLLLVGVRVDQHFITNLVCQLESTPFQFLMI